MGRRKIFLIRPFEVLDCRAQVLGIDGTVERRLAGRQHRGDVVILGDIDPRQTHRLGDPLPAVSQLEDLLAAARTTGSEVEAASNAISALESALRITPVDGLVVVTGSVYLVGQLRPLVIASRPAPTEPLEG